MNNHDMKDDGTGISSGKNDVPYSGTQIPQSESLLSGYAGSWEYETDSKSFWCNPDYFSLLGRTGYLTRGWAKFSIKAVWEDWLHPEDRVRVTDSFTSYVNDPAGVYRQTYRMQHANGSWIWILNQAKVARSVDANTHSLLITGTQLDITHVKLPAISSESLVTKTTEDNIFLYSLLNSPRHILIFGLDTAYRFTFFSKSFQEYINKTLRKEVREGVGVFDIFPWHLHSILKNNFERALSGESFIMNETLYLDEDSINYFRNSYNPLKDENGLVKGVTVFFQDTTAEKSRELINQEREERYSSLFENSNDAIFVADVFSGKISDVNTMACRLMGYSKEEMIGMHQSRLHPPDQLEFLSKQFIEFGTTEGYHSIECDVLQKEGRRIPVQITAGSHFSVGEKMYMAAYFKDLTKDKEAAEEIAHKERLLQRAGNLANVGILEINLQTGERFWSEELYRILGYEPFSVKPSESHFLELVNESDKERFEKWHSKILFQRGQSLPIEIRLTSKEGSEHILLITAMGFTDDKGELIKHVGVVKDITVMKRLELDLNYSHEQLEKLTEQIPVAILQIQMNEKGHISIPFISKAIERIGSSLKVDEILANPFALFKNVSEEDKNRFAQLFYESKVTLKDFSFEFNIQSAIRGKIWVRAAYQPEESADHKTINWYGFIEDITVQKEIQISLEEQNKKLRDIAWTQSHVVRAPLSRLMGLVNLLEEGFIDKKTEQEVFSYIKESAQELDQIVKDITDKTRQIETS